MANYFCWRHGFAASGLCLLYRAYEETYTGFGGFFRDPSGAWILGFVRCLQPSLVLGPVYPCFDATLLESSYFSCAQGIDRVADISILYFTQQC